MLRPYKGEITLIDNKADNNFINETNTETKINQTSETNTNLTAEDFDDEIVKYFEKKHKAKIDLKTNNDLNLEDYIIEFKSKTKKV